MPTARRPAAQGGVGSVSHRSQASHRGPVSHRGGTRSRKPKVVALSSASLKAVAESGTAASQSVLASAVVGSAVAVGASCACYASQYDHGACAIDERGGAHFLRNAVESYEVEPETSRRMYALMREERREKMHQVRLRACFVSMLNFYSLPHRLSHALRVCAFLSLSLSLSRSGGHTARHVPSCSARGGVGVRTPRAA